MKRKKDMGAIMNELAIRTESDIKEMAAVLATFPEPGKWTREQKAQAVQFAALLETAQKMIAVKTLAGINYQSEKETFLNNAGKTESTHTRTAYRAGLDKLEAWAAAQGINVLEITPAQADDFCYSLRGNRASASIRLDTAAASSFFTWLHRRHTAIENPFRGTKARPAKKAVKKIEIPTAPEVKTIIRELPADLAAAAAIMAYRGLRAGALPTLSVTGGRFNGHSKGKDIAGELPAAAVDAIKTAALPLRGPFAGILPNTIEKRIARAIIKMYEAGKVKAAYSCHDLRHHYAVIEYRKDKDIHRVSKLLGHASIQVTETYLQSLGVKD
ncbi:MAG: tyrosine-type recombinase/integrase [Treponema sp.]|jgi:site-specific recombinase XerD|nr:tyrosine-type recombinase/integrase [Treponema sp.]